MNENEWEKTQPGFSFRVSLAPNTLKVRARTCFKAEFISKSLSSANYPLEDCRMFIVPPGTAGNFIEPTELPDSYSKLLPNE